MNDPRSLLEALRAGSPPPGVSEDAFAQARALLHELGSADAARAEALPRPLALALLEGAVVDRAPALPEALVASGRDKALVKEARKALYRLRSAGVAVPERAAALASAPAAPRAEDVLPAVLTALTGNGERMLLTARPLRGGGLEVVQALLSDEHGVVELGVAERSRGDYRKVVKQLQAPEVGAVAVPADEARQRLARAAGRNLASRTPFPRGLDAVLRHLEATADEAELELPPPEDGDVGRSLEGLQLHETEEIAQWLPPERELRTLQQRVQAVLASPLALSEAQRAEQLRGAVDQTAREFFTPPMARLYARRLWEMALHLERTGRAPVADVARGTARRLFHGQLEPLGRFAEFLFEKVLLLSGGTGAPPPERPAPAEEAPKAPPGEKRSPGGLILP